MAEFFTPSQQGQRGRRAGPVPRKDDALSSLMEKREATGQAAILPVKQGDDDSLSTLLKQREKKPMFGGLMAKK